MTALRLYPAVPGNLRTAVVDTVLPLGGGDDGKDPIFIKAGQPVSWNLWSMHRRTDFYGEDAEDFKPERWATLKPGWVSRSRAKNHDEMYALTRNRSIFLSTAVLGFAWGSNLRSQRRAM